MSIYTKDQFINDADTTIGDFTYGNIAVARAYSGCKLNIGKFCSFGQGILMAYYGSHQLYEITTYPFSMLHGHGWESVFSKPVEGQDITIGNDVYIGNHAVIMQGARIDDGAVIGAYSIVKGHVKSYSIVVGNPAREIRTRFAPVKITALLNIKWWDWPIEKIKEHLAVISSPDVFKLYDIWKEEIK